jgi:hypothetical protein
MNDVDSGAVRVDEATVGTLPMALPLQRLAGPSFEGMVPVECFVDLPNIESSLKRLGCFKTDYGELIEAVLRRFANRLGAKAAGRPAGESEPGREAVSDGHQVFCRAVWCVTSKPINFHPADAYWVDKRRRFVTALRRRHHFHVEEVAQDFRGNRVGHHYAFASDESKELVWHPKEKAVDVLLAIRMVKRCLAPDRPAGVILLSGDADYAPAVYEIARRDPPIIVMVAAFRDAISEVYFSGDPAGYCWESTPILLNDCIRDMQAN